MIWWRHLRQRYKETREATLLLHVIDAADSRLKNIHAVENVLEEIDARDTDTVCDE